MDKAPTFLFIIRSFIRQSSYFLPTWNLSGTSPRQQAAGSRQQPWQQQAAAAAAAAERERDDPTFLQNTARIQKEEEKRGV